MRNCSGAKCSLPVSANSQDGALGQTGKWTPKCIYSCIQQIWAAPTIQAATIVNQMHICCTLIVSEKIVLCDHIHRPLLLCYQYQAAHLVLGPKTENNQINVQCVYRRNVDNSNIFLSGTASCFSYLIIMNCCRYLFTFCRGFSS